MKCKKCGCILSPEEKDNVLAALSEGIKQPSAMCEDCIEEQYEEQYEEDAGDEDYDEHYEGF